MPEIREWYIFERAAEGDALFFVDLTSEELNVISRFLDSQHNGPDEGYSGGIQRLTLYGFKTREEAEEHSKDIRSHIWAYGGD